MKAEAIDIIEDAHHQHASKDTQKSKGKLKAEAQKYKDKLEQRGVIYLSRIPPFMKPNKVRTIFEQYGTVSRLYLAEEGEIW
jgi:ESF2/ABP1 family protein